MYIIMTCILNTVYCVSIIIIIVRSSDTNARMLALEAIVGRKCIVKRGVHGRPDVLDGCV